MIVTIKHQDGTQLTRRIMAVTAFRDMRQRYRRRRHRFDDA